MVKLLGMIAVVASTTLIGFFSSREIESRSSQLEKAILMLDEIEIYLKFGVLRCDEIFDKISEKKDYDLLCENNLEKTSLLPKEKQVLYDFYKQFGTTDLDGQLSALSMYRSVISQSCDELNKIKQNKCRLLRTAGVLAGIFVCLVLV